MEKRITSDVGSHFPTKKLGKLTIKSKFQQPKDLIKVFDNAEERIISSKELLSSAITGPDFDFSTYECQVSFKLANKDFLKNHKDSLHLEKILASKLTFQCKQKNLVSNFKERVENDIRKLMPQNLACDLLELRIGERL